jgi:mRNA-degrading endonuclease toxin of MazEF toxin-antitoxin module
MFFGAPITLKIKQGPYFMSVTYSNRKGTVSVVDVRALSSKRLLRKLGVLDEDSFVKVVQKFKKLVG